MSRKVKNSDIEFIEDTLVDLKVQIDNIKTYLESNPWLDIKDETVRKREFKFQADLFDKHKDWLEKYMNLCGIVEFYNQNQVKDEEKLRKGFKENEFMDMIISSKEEKEDED